MARSNEAAERGHSKFRGWGIVEAVLGALAWTFALIVAAILAHRANIDLLEIYKNLSGVH